MRKILFVALLLAPVLAMAQGLRERGASVVDVVPEGWEHMEAMGDMNNDGLMDVAVIATPNFKDGLIEREDGYVYNLNRPHLAIYFGDAKGELVLFKRYEDVLLEASEFVTVDYSLEINKRGVLRIGASTFASAGSSSTGGPTYVFRYQKGDFYLIGKDVREMSRYSGEITEVSENYLTNRRQTRTSNAMEGHENEVSERWTKMDKAPLKRLGEFEF